MRRSFVLSLVLPLTGLPGLAAPASADLNQPVTLTGFRDLEVDETHGQVFISQGSSTIFRANLQGAPIDPVTSVPGASGMALTDDGSTLWVAMKTGDGVAAVDTATLAVTKYPTGPSSCPVDVAVTGGLVWWGSCNGGIGSLDPGTGLAIADLADVNNAVLATSPGAPDSLFALSSGSSALTAWDVTTSEGPALTLRASRDVGSNNADLAVSADGSMVVTASGSPYEHPAYATSDLSQVDSYPSTSYPNAVAIRSDGMVAAGVSGWYEPDVYVYPAGSSTLMRSYEFGFVQDELLPRGLSFGATNLYAVSGYTYNDTNYRLRVITPRYPSTLSLTTNHARYAYGATMTATVKLSTHATNRTVSIYATPYGGTKRLLKTAAVPVGGSITASMTGVRRTTFSAVFEGDAENSRATASGTVQVNAKVAATMRNYLRTSGSYYLYPLTRGVRIRGVVSPNHAGDCAYVRAQFYVNGRWGYDGTTSCIRLSSTSAAVGVLAPDRDLLGIPIRLRVEWRGDTENSATNSVWLKAKYVR